MQFNDTDWERDFLIDGTARACARTHLGTKTNAHTHAHRSFGTSVRGDICAYRHFQQNLNI